MQLENEKNYEVVETTKGSVDELYNLVEESELPPEVTIQLLKVERKFPKWQLALSVVNLLMVIVLLIVTILLT